MSRLIDAEEAIKIIVAFAADNNLDVRSIGYVIHILDTMPTEQAIVRGEQDALN